MTGEQLGAAERITYADVEYRTQRFGEEDVPDSVQEPHGCAFHGVNKPRSVYEITVTFAVCIVEASEHFGRHTKIGVQNYQQVLRRMLKTGESIPSA